MNGNKTIGALLLAAGGGLLVWGYQLYGSLDNRLARTLGAGTSSEAMLALGGGAVCVVVGLVLLRK